MPLRIDEMSPRIDEMNYSRTAFSGSICFGDCNSMEGYGDVKIIDRDSKNSVCVGVKFGHNEAREEYYSRLTPCNPHEYEEVNEVDKMYKSLIGENLPLVRAYQSCLPPDRLDPGFQSRQIVADRDVWFSSTVDYLVELQGQANKCERLFPLFGNYQSKSVGTYLQQFKITP